MARTNAMLLDENVYQATDLEMLRNRVDSFTYDEIQAAYMNLADGRSTWTVAVNSNSAANAAKKAHALVTGYIADNVKSANVTETAHARGRWYRVQITVETVTSWTTSSIAVNSDALHMDDMTTALTIVPEDFGGNPATRQAHCIVKALQTQDGTGAVYNVYDGYIIVNVPCTVSEPVAAAKHVLECNCSINGDTLRNPATMHAGAATLVRFAFIGTIEPNATEDVPTQAVRMTTRKCAETRESRNIIERVATRSRIPVLYDRAVYTIGVYAKNRNDACRSAAAALGWDVESIDDWGLRKVYRVNRSATRNGLFIVMYRADSNDRGIAKSTDNGKDTNTMTSSTIETLEPATIETTEPVTETQEPETTEPELVRVPSESAAEMTFAESVDVPHIEPVNPPMYQGPKTEPVIRISESSVPMTESLAHNTFGKRNCSVAINAPIHDNDGNIIASGIVRTGGFDPMDAIINATRLSEKPIVDVVSVGTMPNVPGYVVTFKATEAELVSESEKTSARKPTPKQIADAKAEAYRNEAIKALPDLPEMPETVDGYDVTQTAAETIMLNGDNAKWSDWVDRPLPENAPTNAFSYQSRKRNISETANQATLGGTALDGFKAYPSDLQSVLLTGMKSTVTETEYRYLSAAGEVVSTFTKKSMRTNQAMPTAEMIGDAFAKWETANGRKLPDDAAIDAYNKELGKQFAALTDAVAAYTAFVQSGNEKMSDDDLNQCKAGIKAAQSIFQELPRIAGMPRGFRFAMADLRQVTAIAGNTIGVIITDKDARKAGLEKAFADNATHGEMVSGLRQAHETAVLGVKITTANVRKATFAYLSKLARKADLKIMDAKARDDRAFTKSLSELARIDAETEQIRKETEAQEKAKIEAAKVARQVKESRPTVEESKPETKKTKKSAKGKKAATVAA